MIRIPEIVIVTLLKISKLPSPIISLWFQRNLEDRPLGNLPESHPASQYASNVASGHELQPHTRFRQS